MASTTFTPPEPSGPPRIDLMSRLGLGRPGPSRRKAGAPSTTATSKSTPKHRAEK